MKIVLAFFSLLAGLFLGSGMFFIGGIGLLIVTHPLPIKAANIATYIWAGICLITSLFFAYRIYTEEVRP